MKVVVHFVLVAIEFSTQGKSYNYIPESLVQSLKYSAATEHVFRNKYHRICPPGKHVEKKRIKALMALGCSIRTEKVRMHRALYLKNEK